MLAAFTVPSLIDITINTIVDNYESFQDARSILNDQQLAGIIAALKERGKLNDESLYYFLPKVIEKLHLECMCNISDYGVMAISLLVGPQLKELKLSGTRISNVGVIGLARACPNLTELSLAGCSQITSESIQSIATHCPKIKDLDLRECLSLDYNTWKICFSMPKLAILNLGSCTNIIFPSEPLEILEEEDSTSDEASSNDDESGKQQNHTTKIKYNTTLYYLSLSQNPAINDTAISHIVGRCSSLCVLDLTATRITDAAMTYIAASPSTNSINCIHLSFTSIQDDGLITLVNACKKIKNLSIQGCAMITETSIIHIIANLKQTLEFLSIGGCIGISRFALHLLFSHIKKLKFCYLSSILATSQPIADYSIEGLELNKDLKTLYLNRSKMSETAFMKLASPNLTSLDISNCSNLTQGSVIDFLKMSQNLTTLDMSGIVISSPADFNIALQDIPNLQHLHLLDTQNLNDETIDTIISIHQTNLQSISIGSVIPEAISDERLAALLLQCGNLSSFVVDVPQLGNSFFKTVATYSKIHHRSLGVRKLKLSKVAAETRSVCEFLEHCNRVKVLCIQNAPHLGSLLGYTIGKYCHELEQLDLKNNREIIASGYKHIIDGCPGLRSLLLSGSAVPDKTLRKIESLKLINTLGLVGCKNITVEALESMIKATSSSLRYLFLNDNRAYSTETIESLTSLSPWLRIDSTLS